MTMMMIKNNQEMQQLSRYFPHASSQRVRRNYFLRKMALVKGEEEEEEEEGEESGRVKERMATLESGVLALHPKS